MKLESHLTANKKVAMVSKRIKIQVMYRAVLAEKERLKIERDLIDEKLIAAEMLIEELKRKLPASSQSSSVYFGKKLSPCLRMIIKHANSKLDTDDVEKQLIDGGYKHSGKKSLRHSITTGLGNLVLQKEIEFTGNKGNRKYSWIKIENNQNTTASNNEVEIE